MSTFKGLIPSVVKLEHRVHSFIIKRKLPKSFKRLYGKVRVGLGILVYGSGSNAVVKSPNYIIASVLSKGKVYIDVGANTGEMLFMANQKVGPGGMSYGFEPRDEGYANIKTIIDSVGSKNCILFKSVVGNYDGQCTFYENPEDPESSSIAAEWTDTTKAVTYPITTLDSWMKVNSISKASLMKVDVEGAEIDVFKGASMLLRELQPITIFEINNRETRRTQFGYDIQDIMTLLSASGYDEFYTLRIGGLARIMSGNELLDHDHDMIAFSSQNEQHSIAKKKLKVSV